MEQGPSIWFVLFGLAWIAISLGGWIRFRSQRADMDAQVDNAQWGLESSEGSHAKVTMFRKRSVIGLRNLHYICCDGQPISALKNGRHNSVLVPTGEHVFAAQDDGGPVPSAPITATLEPDEEVFIEFSRRGLTSVTFTMIDPVQAPREMVGLKSAV